MLLKKMFRYIKPYWKMALAAPLLMLLEVVMDLMQPMFMARIIDIGIRTGDVNFIINTGLGMIGIAIIGVAAGLGCVVLSNIASQNFATDLRLDIFKKVQAFSFADLDKFKTGSLITRLTNDVGQVQMVVAMMMRIMIRAPLLFIGGLTMAFIINARMAFVMLATVPLLAMLLAVLIQKGFALFAKAQQKLDKVNTVLQENLAGIRVVKVFGRAEHERQRFGSSVEQLMDYMIRVARITSIAMPMVMFIMNVAVVAVIWVGGLEVRAGTMQVGQVMAFISYAGQILFSMAMMAMLLMFVSRAKASADRIVEVLDVQPSISDMPGNAAEFDIDGRLDFVGVSFGYGGAEHPMVLKNVSFSARAGQTVAILGATGSGKTSLVNLIPRFYDVVQGQVLVGGRDVRNIPMHLLRGRVGTVLQESVLLSGSIADNIRLGKEDATDEELTEVAKIAQIHEFIVGLADGYDAQIGQRGVNLSGGQKQRLAIARALVKKPAILILDDSTSAIDLETEWYLHKAIKENAKDITCIVIAQRINSVMRADIILVIDDGHIVAQGTHDHLMEHSPVYFDIYRSQMEEEAS